MDTDICSSFTLNTVDTYYHAMWLCPSVQTFSEGVIEKTSDLLGCSLPLSPSLCLLEDPTVINPAPNNTRPTLIAITTAKKTILRNWKTRDKLSTSHWLNILTEYISMEKLSAALQDQTHYFEATWTPLLLRALHLLPVTPCPQPDKWCLKSINILVIIIFFIMLPNFLSFSIVY